MKILVDILNIIGFFLLLEPFVFLDTIYENFMIGKRFEDDSFRGKIYHWIHKAKYSNHPIGKWTLSSSRKSIGIFILFVGSILGIFSDLK